MNAYHFECADEGEQQVEVGLLGETLLQHVLNDALEQTVPCKTSKAAK
jgi:hypothetical protein